MYGTEIAGDGTLKPGDNWGDTTYYADYFSPAYYRVFARATDNPVWAGVIIDRNYTLLASLSGPNGLVPNGSDTVTLSTSTAYGYNACRAPWRIAMDYCFNGEPRAKTYLDKVGAFLQRHRRHQHRRRVFEQRCPDQRQPQHGVHRHGG